MVGKGLIAILAAALLWTVPAAVAASGPTGPTGPSGSQPATITLKPSRAEIMSGQHVTLSGKVTGTPSTSTVWLYQSRYPFPIASFARSTTTSSSGSFHFTVAPDRDTRYRVVLVGTSETSLAEVDVTGRTITRVKALPLGRARVTVVVFHPRDLDWGRGRVDWSFASGRGRFRRAPATRTVRLSRYVVVLSTTATLPAGHFIWRACLHAPQDDALASPRRPPGCTGRGYHGGGSLPVGFPNPAAIARAERYLASRGGHTALALVDSEGRLSGVHVHDRFITGSVVKAMLLVAYLRRLDAIGQHTIDSNSASILFPMINVSDNNAATECWSIVGDGGLYGLARAAGMTDFSVPTSAPWGGEWGTALLSAADQAKFFFEMDSLVPREFVGYARFLLSHIAGYESWGIPAIARPLGYTVFFKAGWRPSPDVYLVHQIARLEGHRRTFSMAVMTDGDPDMGYGIDTIQGVTAALLR
jgi:hypothetical protein